MTNPLAQDLGGVVRLLEKATPGEWRVSGECVVFDDRRLVCCGRGRYECCGDPDVDGAEHPIVGLLGGNPNISDVETIAACVNFLRTHSAEIAVALRDAERYRWLRAQNAITETPDSWTITRCDFTDEDDPIRYWVGDDLDNVIDYAMQQGGGGGEAAA